MTRHRSTLPLALGVPLAVIVATVLLVRSWHGDLPDPVATHWGASGRADGFTSLGMLTLLMTGVVLVLTLVLVAAFTYQRVPARVMTGMTGGLAAFCATLFVTSLLAQRGATDAATVRFDPTWIGIALVAGLLVAGAVAVLTRPDIDAGSTPNEPSPALTLADGSDAVWVGRVTNRVQLAGAALLAVVGLVLLVLPVWPIGLAVLGISALLGLFASWTVTAGDHGLRAHAVPAVVRLGVPVDEITGAEVVQVAPIGDFGDFGGWGVRSGRLASALWSSARARRCWCTAVTSGPSS